MKKFEKRFSFKEMKMDKDYLILEDNVRYSFMSVVWSHKIQEKQADILTEKYNRFETIRIICASLTSVGLISLVFSEQFIIKVLSTLISFVSTAISLFFKSYDIQKNITNHKNTANELLYLRDKFRFLLVEIKTQNMSVKNLIEKYEDLLEQLNKVYKTAPNTTDEAVNRASNYLKIKKDNEFTDDEIDMNLPETLKRRGI